jgi:hypothetical protein
MLNAETTQVCDDRLLCGAPDFISISGFLKAVPVEEAGRRIVYIEASNEAVDAQGEVVMAKALAESADYYKQFGNIDIDHYTQIGARQGIPDYTLYEIGRPVDVTVRDGRTFVKGELYSGPGQAAERASQVWSSLTEISPPARWYPSVGGQTLEKAVAMDGDGNRRAYIKKVRWTNVALSKTPVNQTVPSVQTMPMPVFAKCWGANGLDFAKALEAGYGTDSAALTGGGALRTQSLHGAPMGYMEFRDRLATAIRKGQPSEKGAQPMVALAMREMGLAQDKATAWVERFLRDLEFGLKRRK